MLKKKIAVALISSIGLAATPLTALASAYGYQYWTSFKVNILGQTVTLPKGQLFHAIEGKGSHIDIQGANYGSASNLCDASIRFTYGNGTQHVDSTVQSGCSIVGQWKYKMDFNVPRGDACAELWAKNWKAFVAKQCHYVSP